MIRTLALLRPSSSSPATCSSSPFSSQDARSAVISARRSASTICCSSRSDAYIPKLEPFSRSKFDRVIKDPPLIEKSENDLLGNLSGSHRFLLMFVKKYEGFVPRFTFLLFLYLLYCASICVFIFVSDCSFVNWLLFRLLFDARRGRFL